MHVHSRAGNSCHVLAGMPVLCMKAAPACVLCGHHPCDKPHCGVQSHGLRESGYHLAHNAMFLTIVPQSLYPLSPLQLHPKYIQTVVRHDINVVMTCDVTDRHGTRGFSCRLSDRG
jgi:hypothetical protein